MQRAAPNLVAFIEPVVTGLGFDFIGAEFGQAENGQTLRVYIDKADGIVHEDCALVSRQLSAVLDVEEQVASAYQLEVSSPGVDRPLFTVGHFAAAVGQTVRIRLLGGLGGRRNFKGELMESGDSSVTVEVDGIDHVLPLADVEQAQIIGKV